jgi:UDPglucose 6-dehydrogenase
MASMPPGLRLNIILPELWPESIRSDITHTAAADFGEAFAIISLAPAEIRMGFSVQLDRGSLLSSKRNRISGRRTAMHDSVSVVGLGKLGVCLAACAASKGVRVIGVDLNPRTIALVNNGKPPVIEPGLAEMIEANRERLKATRDMSVAVAESSISFIVVPTPSEPSGAFSLRYVMRAIEEIGRSLRNKNDYHLVVVVSTVLPGSTEFGILPILERSSGKSCGKDFGLCYGPEFIALGDVLRGMLRPDFVLIGEWDTRAGMILQSWYERFCENSPPICRMNLVNAELTKIAVNTYVTTKISFSNMLSTICERLPGADVDTVTNALGLDSRIGRRYLTGGLATIRPLPLPPRPWDAGRHWRRLPMHKIGCCARV